MSNDMVFIQEQYKPVKIKSIKHVKNENNVYDLEVAGASTYCTGNNIIGHNSDMGAKAKLTRQFFRTYARKMQKLNIACVMTAHLTENIGGYGPLKTVAGGTIMGYIPSIEVRFTKNNKDSEMEQSAVGTSMVKIRAEIIKSRFGTHGKRVNFDLNMSSGLDEYAGLSDILKDYGFMIPASADLDKQIEEKIVPKKSSGWWMFKPWDNPVTEKLFKKMIDEGLCGTGKFREKQVKDFCAEYEWFRDDVAYLLASIYDKNLVSESGIVEGTKDLLTNEPTDITDKNTSEVVDKPKKNTKKADVKVTKVK